MTFLRRASVVALVLSLGPVVGCVSPITEGELEARLGHVRQSASQSRAVKRVFPVYAATRMEAWTLRLDARLAPEESGPSLALAAGFKVGERKYLDYFVGGPYADLVDQIVRNALAMNEGRRLRGLRVVLVSDEAPSPALRAAAAARGAKVVHYPLR